MSKVDEFLEAKLAAGEKRRQQELHHLEQWRESKDPAHLKPLLQSYAPVIAGAMRMYKAPDVPESAMRAELTEIAIKAFESYDPTRGAQLNTHVQNHMKKSMRFNGKYQNVGYIPPEQTQWIGKIQRAQSDLQDSLNRAPTDHEIAQHVGNGLTPHMVTRVKGNLRADINTSAFEEDPFEQDGARDQEVLSLLPLALGPKDKEVFSYLYGDKQDKAPMLGGRVNMGALAKQLNMSSSQISRSHKVIKDTYKKYR